MNNSNVIYFNKVNFLYGEQQVLHNLSFAIDRGEFICLTGKSGCGKSTLLRLMNGLLQRQSGEINVLMRNIDEWEIHKMRRKMGYVLQEGSLFPHFTAYQNMCYCMKLNDFDDNKCQIRINELLPLIDLEHNVLNKFPHELSGGQRQRVGIIRAIAHNPEIVLMDEPFSALDAETRESLQKLVKDIHLKLNTTFVMVTHSKLEADKLGTRVIEMFDGKVASS